jgi:alkylation response protein AidB-like acyl-CoA dehydrogenase
MNAALVADGLTIRPIRTMMNHTTTEVFFDQVRLACQDVAAIFEAA